MDIFVTCSQSEDKLFLKLSDYLAQEGFKKRNTFLDQLGYANMFSCSHHQTLSFDSCYICLLSNMDEKMRNEVKKTKSMVEESENPNMIAVLLGDYEPTQADCRMLNGFSMLYGVDKQEALDVIIEKLGSNNGYDNVFNSNDSDAIYSLGEGFLHDEDPHLAFKCFEKAANLGNPVGAYMTGKCYMEGNGTFKDSDRAMAYYRASAEQDYGPAQYQLGLIYFEGKLMPKNDKLAFEYFTNASINGSEEANYDLSLFYRDGIIVKKDKAKYYELLQRAAEYGKPMALYLAGRHMLETGREASEAVRNIRTAAMKNCPEAACYLGHVYTDGIYIKTDYKKAYEYFYLGSSHGNAECSYEIAMMFLKGDVLAKNEERAILYLNMAANKGYEKAVEELKKHKK